MAHIFSVSMLAGAALAFYFALQYLRAEEKQYKENCLLILLCIGSSIWSMGFGELIVQTDSELAYWCRFVGMIGTFLYLITAQILISLISELELRWRQISQSIALLGIPVYFLAVRRGETVYYLTDFGMSYYFRAGPCNTIYTLYTVAVAINIGAVVLHMMFCSEAKRVRAFGKSFLRVGLLVVFGMVLDTIFPMIGKGAIPGSSLTQFWGLLVLRYAVSRINRSKVTLSNMSEFIYYSLDMPVLVYDVNYRLQIMNDAAAAFLDLKSGAHKENIGLDVLFEIEAGDGFSFSGSRKDVDTLCRKNGIYCSLAINRICDGYGDAIGYIILVTDLSERLRAMHELEAAMQEAKSANKAKSTFLANMSHEIRTPMNAIIGFSELALKMELSGQVREYVEDIRASSNNLLSIINDILDISKIESGKMELVCGAYYSAGLMNDVFQIINQQAAKKGLKFKMDIDPLLPSQMYGDKVRIRGILINLLNNAVKYTNQGSVTFAVKTEFCENDVVALKFMVSDTGIGIRQEEQARLFDSFTQADYKLHYNVEGSGLGLAIAKGYVTLMGGTIAVESTYGHGSVFTVEIRQKIVDKAPMEQNGRAEMTSQGSSIGSIKFEGVSALVVDDSRINLRVAQASLAHYGLQVDTASSGREAIELCRQKKYPLIFMDQMMPEMSGIEAMLQIRALDVYYAPGGSGKMIVLTADAVSGAREKLLREGFDEYLGKPMNYKRLEYLLKQFLPEAVCRTETESLKN